MTYLLRLADVEVSTASLEPDNELIEQSGAHYACTRDTDLSELGKFDLVIEAAGQAQLMAQTLGLLRRSGVACLLGIDPRNQKVELDGPVLGVDTILENRVLFGSVNAHRRDWLAAVADLDRARERWPDALEQFVTLRVPLDRFAEAFDHRAGKATLVSPIMRRGLRPRVPAARALRRPRPASRSRRLRPRVSPPSNAATPPRKNVKNGSKLARSTGSSRTFSANSLVERASLRAAVYAFRCAFSRVSGAAPSIVAAATSSPCVSATKTETGLGRFSNDEIHDRLCVFELHPTSLAVSRA